MAEKKVYNWRFYLLFVFILLAMAGLIARLVFLNFFERDFLQKQSSARTLRTVSTPAYRGMISDRNGQPLAISTPVDSLWANPQRFEINNEQLTALASLLGSSKDAITGRIESNQEREFIYLKRGLQPSISQEIKALDIPGLHFQREYRRYYPQSEITAHVVGFTNIDDNGQEGLELAFNDWLRGEPGKKKVIIDRLGRVVAELAQLKTPQQGNDLTLTIDSRIQFLAYRSLQETLEKHQADAGTAVVLDIKSGEILAMVNLPTYNPNRRPEKNQGQYRNRAVTDVFEPGSTMKAFSVMNGLASGEYHRDTMIDTNPGWMVLNNRTINDIRNLGVISLKDVLTHSSNIGVSRITLSLPEQSLWHLLHHMGFGERTQSGFPGEASGTLPRRAKWRAIDLATLSYGYGVSVTALQLAQAYATLASGGILRPVTFVKDQVNDSSRILKEKVAEDMLSILEQVVADGSGRRAQIPGYRVAGKTGTAYVAGPNGYDNDRYVASFAGVAPISDPQLVVAVIIFDPKEGHFGSTVAAPAFAKIMGGSLRMHNVPPDDLST